MQSFFIGLGQKQTYNLNGVRYEVSSKFVKDKVESKIPSETGWSGFCRTLYI